MRVAAVDAVEPVLPACRRKYREPADHGDHRQAVPRSAVVQIAANGAFHATAGPPMQSNSCAASDPQGTAGADLPDPKHQQVESTAQGLTLSSEWTGDHPAQPGLVRRYQLCPNLTRLCTWWPSWIGSAARCWLGGCPTAWKPTSVLKEALIPRLVGRCERQVKPENQTAPTQ